MNSLQELPNINDIMYSIMNISNKAVSNNILEYFNTFYQYIIFPKNINDITKCSHNDINNLIKKLWEYYDNPNNNIRSNIQLILKTTVTYIIVVRFKLSLHNLELSVLNLLKIFETNDNDINTKILVTKAISLFYEVLFKSQSNNKNDIFILSLIH